MSSISEPNNTQSLNDLIPYVVDVVEHALSLQSQAKDSVTRVEGAATVVLNASNLFVSNQDRMAKSIEDRVCRRFDATIDGASDRINQQVSSIEKQAKDSLTDLIASIRIAVQTINDERKRLESDRWVPALISGFLGMMIGGLGVALWIGHFR